MDVFQWNEFLASGALVPDDDADSDGSQAASRAEDFLKFVAAPRFPCVGAKAALSRGTLEPHAFGRLGDRQNDRLLLQQLARFARVVEATPAGDLALHSFVAVFDGPDDTDEQRFEALLWAQLQRLHDLEVGQGTAWAPDVSTDPDDPHFSLSLGGHPFFVIGLHPGASRLARRFQHPALVFNSHRQFERLREDRRFERMKRATRKRDKALQGSINPNLADFGQAGETRQYSGRRVGPEWRCPFRFHGTRAEGT